MDPHDGKYEPENETHEEDIENAGDGLDQSVDHNLDKDWIIFQEYINELKVYNPARSFILFSVFLPKPAKINFNFPML